jgi:hypothetical protein
MSDQSPLIIPMVVEAFVVNDDVRQSPNFYERMPMNYNVIQDGSNGQPAINDTNFTQPPTFPVPPHSVPASTYYNGVYLKWRLPDAFTHGKQVGGTTQYPPVPNRWLVVRYGGTDLAQRTATAWVVESDYVWPGGQPPLMNASQDGSMYLQATAANPIPVGITIGRNVPLGSWQEPGPSLGLTAVAPGNTAFAFYQPHCNNVFSLIDCLDAVAPQPFSYAVYGWFSDPKVDPLASATGETFPTILQGLDWNLPPKTDPTLSATWSLLSGAVTGVQWQTTQPKGGAPNSTPLSVALGNTSIEALTALITAQAAQQGMIIDSELLEAFQLDLIDVLDQPDGAGLLAERLQASFFQKFSGGYAWTIVDTPGSDTPPSAEELAKEAAWLAVLNQNQIALDQAITTLTGLQAQLYAMWWKCTYWPTAFQGTSAIPHLDAQDALQQQLDPTVAGTIAQQTAAQLSAVQSQGANVPNGDTPAALQQAIDAYAAAQDLPATRLLKRSAAARFYLPNNPVVLLAGAGSSGIVQSSAGPQCRFPSQLATGFNFQGQAISASTPGLSIPRPDVSQVSGVPWTPALLASLVQEFFFVDTNNAPAVAAAIPGSSLTAVAAAMSQPSDFLAVYPLGAVEAWTQNPWHPLLLSWTTIYWPIAYGTPQSPNWTFHNGRYAWNGQPSAVGAQMGPQGWIQLAPTAALNMEARLTKFLKDNPNLPPDEVSALKTLLQFVQTDDSWDLLSQALDGFNHQLLTGSPGVYLSPASTSPVTNPPLAQLIGDVATYPPNVQNIPMQGQPIPPSQFQPWRAGQFEFFNLVLIDEWGQALWPIDSTNYTRATVFLPDGLTPEITSNSVNFIVSAGPVIASIEPMVALAGAPDLTLTVNGAGFDASTAVQWNGTALATTPVSAAQVTAVVPASLLAAPAAAHITFSAGGGPAATFTVSGGPVIGALSPALIQAGMAVSALTDLTVTGAGFAAGAAVQWNGTALDTEVVDENTLIGQVPASFLLAPGTASVMVNSGTSVSNTMIFTISAGAAITSLTPSVAVAGGAGFALTVSGVGFAPTSILWWAGAQLTTTYVNDGQLTAMITAEAIAAAGTVPVMETFGAKIKPAVTDCFIQVPPALLQPARLAFDLISAVDDSIYFGPANPGADPICGWILPNHLDASLMAYDAAGTALGEMSVGISATDTSTICWNAAPSAPWSTLQDIAAHIPHFGPFLLALSGQSPAQFTDFLQAIDETLWTTVPMGTAFDQSLAVLIGRPLAMVRARLQFLLQGAPYPDPAWQFTFNPQTPEIVNYPFAVELGNLEQLNDGLIGYFVGDQYDQFNVVTESGAAGDGYLRPIGQNNNYLFLPCDNTTATYVSMLVDPRAAVHATTGILPVVELRLPPQFVNGTIAAMQVAFRMDGVLTDQQISQAGDTTILIPVPKEKTGTWTWMEKDQAGWTSYPTAAPNAVARLSNVPPVLRRGLLQLSSALSESAETNTQE